jgi:hypothetical protein
MHSSGDTEEVIMGEITDNDFRLVGKSFDGPEVVGQFRGCSIFAEVGIGPFVTFESPFQIPSANKEKACIDSCAAERTAGQLGYGTGAGPFVGEYDETHSHCQSITKILKLRKALAKLPAGGSMQRRRRPLLVSPAWLQMRRCQ